MAIVRFGGIVRTTNSDRNVVPGSTKYVDPGRLSYLAKSQWLRCHG